MHLSKKFQDSKTENATMAHRQTRHVGKEEKYMIFTTISHPRTFHVDFFCMRETPAKTF